MSAPLANKFQDHYAVLDIDPKSDLETIQKVYSKLSKEYHPKTPVTGNQEKFDAVNLAYEVLSDRGLRNQFDQLKGLNQGEAPKFSAEFFDALAHGTGLRGAVLCILYDHRRRKPRTPGMSMRHLEGMLETTNELLGLTLWYLKSKNLAAADDKSNMLITVEGMDFLESHQPTPEAILPFIKKSSLAEAHGEPQAHPHKPAEKSASTLASEGESMRNRLTRALARA
jgi:curved DNA-binding protein CbpA